MPGVRANGERGVRRASTRRPPRKRAISASSDGILWRKCLGCKITGGYGGGRRAEEEGNRWTCDGKKDGREGQFGDGGDGEREEGKRIEEEGTEDGARVAGRGTEEKLAPDEEEAGGREDGRTKDRSSCMNRKGAGDAVHSVHILSGRWQYIKSGAMDIRQELESVSGK
ncbi:hypothetical protein C8J57DRAFT_1236872 [Mycena rebaudengoi]|nr:hypothetical protein C8J57DRAFT_1236872 [Mycena rebaudengoi]